MQNLKIDALKDTTKYHIIWRSEQCKQRWDNGNDLLTSDARCQCDSRLLRLCVECDGTTTYRPRQKYSYDSNMNEKITRACLSPDYTPRCTQYVFEVMHLNIKIDCFICGEYSMYWLFNTIHFSKFKTNINNIVLEEYFFLLIIISPISTPK